VPRSLSQHVLARRALIEDVASDKRGWVHHSVAVLGISVLGLGVAGSVAMTGSAHNTTHGASSPQVVTSSLAPPSVLAASHQGGQAPSAFDRRADVLNRSAVRPPLAAAAVDQRADLRAVDLQAAARKAQLAAQDQAVKLREKKLAAEVKAAQKKAKHLHAVRAARAAKASAAKASADKAAAHKKAQARSGGTSQSSHHFSLPITSGFHIAARFGDTGSWSRYHTGLDFAAPIGTTIHAAASGVVTHAGSGAAGWAGHYVAIKHADGKSTLYAHMSTVSVHVGERVTGGQRVGAVGMTGRSFGPHVHFELYPSGVKPGDLYKAINPAPWLHAHGLHF
jgi:murein DD-endopeptidase MepM/ murein hydrolase activator NlpD